MIVGITGGTGCGKTTALQAVADLGGLVLDCDEIYHRLLEQDTALLRAIENRFPSTVENGVLQRKKLGSIVFSDKKALEDLNKITHSAIRKEVQRQLNGHHTLAAIDAVALFESGLAQLCDFTVAIWAPEEVRVARLMAREGISAEYAQKRIAAQRPQSDFCRMCNYVLENREAKDEFYAKCLAFFRQTCIMESDNPPDYINGGTFL